MENDMYIIEFAIKISMLKTKTPISDEFDKEYGQKKKVWWSSQREHLTAWCINQITLGTPDFKRKHPNYSAKKCTIGLIDQRHYYG